MYSGSYAASIDSLRVLRKIDPFEFEYCPVLRKIDPFEFEYCPALGKIHLRIRFLSYAEAVRSLWERALADREERKFLKGISSCRSCRS